MLEFLRQAKTAYVQKAISSPLLIPYPKTDLWFRALVEVWILRKKPTSTIQSEIVAVFFAATLTNAGLF